MPRPRSGRFGALKIKASVPTPFGGAATLADRTRVVDLAAMRLRLPFVLVPLLSTVATFGACGSEPEPAPGTPTDGARTDGGSPPGDASVGADALASDADRDLRDATADAPDVPSGSRACSALGLAQLTQSPFCWAHPRPFGNAVRAIGQHRDRWWVSTDVGLFESGDGVQWVNRAPEVGLFGAIRSDDGLLIVPSERGVFTSRDGATWQRTTTDEFESIEKRGGTWLGLHFQSGLSSSLDGRTWTVRVPGSEFYPAAAAYANGVWVVSGAERSGQASFRTSTDGVRWSARVIVETLRFPLSALATNGSVFVATGSNERERVVYTSNDGASWTARAPFHRSSVTSLRWTGSAFIAATSADGVFTSSDGLNWTKLAGSRNFMVLGHGGLGFFGVEEGTRDLLFSSDGSTWASRRNALVPVTNTGVDSLAYGNDRFVALVGRFAATSVDGLTWSAASAGGQFFRKPVFADRRWIALDTRGLVTSEDGLAWTSIAGAPLRPEAVAWGNGTWIATDVSQVWRSPDGATWSLVDRPGLTGSLTSNSALMFASGLFVRVRGNLSTSPDGARWTERVRESASLTSVAFGAGRFVAIAPCVSSGEQPPALTSADGATWSPIVASPPLCGDAIAYGPGGFAVLVSGDISPFRDSVLRLSDDGVSWTRSVPLGTPQAYSITAGAGRWVVGSAFGSILASPGAL
jgi:hypothetical protein